MEQKYSNNEILVMILVIVIILFIGYSIHYENFELIEYPINKITPQVRFNPNAEIAFVYFYTHNIFPYAKHSMLNILSYAEKYNYGVIIYDKPFNDNVSLSWNKIAAIIENLSKDKYKYLIWIDADAVISNFNIKIESFIDANPSVDLYLCMDIIIQKYVIDHSFSSLLLCSYYSF